MNKLTSADLDKLDALQAIVQTAIKDEKFNADLEVFLRTEFSAFMGRAIEKYNGNSVAITTNGASY